MPPCAECARSGERHGDGPFLAEVGRLVQAHRLRLARVARQEGVHGEDALDTVQDAFHTFLTLPRAPALLAAPDDAARVLTAIVRNAARNRRRRHHHARPHDSRPEVLEALEHAAPGGDERLARREELVRLRCCVSTLGELQRQVVTLRLLEEQPGEDVADVLGITPGHVAVMLHRAKAQLRACLTADGG